jgi:hypothetical protein
MSLSAFQRALSDLAASPRLCRELRARAGDVLDRYDLTHRERSRLEAICRQPGMSTCCTLYRINRLTPIYTLLPYTCFLLAHDLQKELDVFWEVYRDTDLQFEQESRRFAEFLLRRIDAGHLSDPFLEEVIRFEMTLNALRFRPRPAFLDVPTDPDSTHQPVLTRQKLTLNARVRLVPFRHEPLTLLHALAEKRSPRHDLRDLTEGDFYLLLDARGEGVEAQPIDARLGRFLHRLEHGSLSMGFEDAVDALVEAGWVEFR